MNELTIHYSRCNFCFKWFEFVCKIRCPLAVCEECFTKVQGTEQLKVTSANNCYVYRVMFVQTPQRCDEEELLHAEKDEHKKSAYEELDQAFHEQIQELVSRYRKCKRRLDYLEPDATFEELKEAIDSFRKAQPDHQMVSDCLNSKRVGATNEVPHSTQADENIQKEFESRLSNMSAEKQLSSSISFQKTKPVESLNTSSRLIQPRKSLCLNTLQRVPLRSGASTTSRSIKEARMSEPSSVLKTKIGTLFQKEEKCPADRMMIEKIFVAAQKTTNKAGTIELVGHKLDDIDFNSYLSVLDWKDVQSVKLVKVQLGNEHFKTLMNFLRRNPQIQTLVLTNNQLSHQALEYLQEASENLHLKNIYLGNNTLYTPRAKQLIRQLRSKLNVFV